MRRAELPIAGERRKSYRREDLVEQKTVDSRQYIRGVGAIVFAGSVVAAAAGLNYSVLPVLLESLGNQFNLDPRQIGWLGSDYLGGIALGGLTSILWIDRIRWRAISAGCLLTLAAGMFAAYLLGPGIAAMAVIFVIGFAAGAVYSIAIAAIAGTPTPQKGFAVMLAVELGSGTVMLWVLPPWVIEPWGAHGAVLVISALVAISAVACLWLPNGGVQQRQSEAAVGGASKAERIAPWIGVVALTVHIGFFTGLWVFLEKIGLDRGMSGLVTGRVLTGSLAVATILALVASLIGGKGRLIVTLLSAMAAQSLGAIALMLRPDVSSFFVGTLLIVGPFAFALSYQLALIAVSDTTGKAAAFSGGAQLIGVAAGPALIGSMIAGHGYQPAYATFLVATLASLATFIYVSRRACVAT
jgi:hypothetical protein